MSDRFVALLRHGEVQGGSRFRGGHDDALAETGWAQMAAAVACASGWTRIVASPARRCAAFAHRLAVERDCPLTLDPAFGERRFGDWEGREARDIPPDELARFWADPAGYTPPGAEPFADFRRRILDGWSRLLQDPAPSTLLVTHGGPIRLIVAATLGLADDSGIVLEVPYACLTRLRVPPPPGRPSLVSHGEPRR